MCVCVTCFPLLRDSETRLRACALSGSVRPSPAVKADGRGRQGMSLRLFAVADAAQHIACLPRAWTPAACTPRRAGAGVGGRPAFGSPRHRQSALRGLYQFPAPPVKGGDCRGSPSLPVVSFVWLVQSCHSGECVLRSVCVCRLRFPRR